MASEVEETLKRLVSHKGVIGTIVVNNEGVRLRKSNIKWRKVTKYKKVPIKSTLDNATTVQYSGLLNNLVDQAKTMFKELDPTNDLTFLRIRTKVITTLWFPWSDMKLIVIFFFRSTRSWWPQTETTCLLWSKTPRMPRLAFICEN